MNQPQLVKVTIEKMISRYSKNIERLVKRFVFSKMIYDRWLEEDLIQEGYLGLIEAFGKYDFSKSDDFFWRYAYKFVKGKIVDFTIKHFNHVKPSKKVNSLITQIINRNLIGKSAYFISESLECSYNMAVNALQFLMIRRVTYLHEKIVSSKEQLEEKLTIDTLAIEIDQDVIFQVESLNSFSKHEKEIAIKLMDGYSRENIIEHCGITALQLKVIIDGILDKCGVAHEYISDRNEVLLMQLSKLQMNGELEESAKDKKFEWVRIELISASSKNPRKDLTVHTEQLQDVIASKGWEEPVTCYKKGDFYILLAGHRRWYAAKQLGYDKMPVFIVDSPETYAEEKDRLGSLQSVQVDWTPYEIAKNIHDRWIYSGGINYSEFSKKIGIPKSKIAAKIRVFKYYPKIEIEDKLTNGMYSISMLDYIISWIKRLVQYQPKFVDSISEEYVRHQMLAKYENKCFNSQIANDRYFVFNATSEEIFSFLSDTTKTLKQSEIELKISRSKKSRDHKEIYKMLDDSMSSVKKIEWKDQKEAILLIDELDSLLSEINALSRKMKGRI
ncbi:ParB N-terminal domain-containing protein [Paenibacillus cucumis (ex Kampfer et al. 2016)]|uniref:ParB N-terminal domain-containing protein n=1 Tax=Paenibacillus cucumis (ex Kampfer et al. 2016) TaxID=1776858 RepID=A0ABS7KNU1_9BACL|nr:ParB N-terminal domain-containing protein [Paenibacillus cucumis (ex Kampfer et al. 2016)]MBY0205800.1 ParB N-terminal domain-containing protein [Paenibacillus cucumis (ex Kampfer et al. 2016)]